MEEREEFMDLVGFQLGMVRWSPGPGPRHDCPGRRLLHHGQCILTTLVRATKSLKYPVQHQEQRVRIHQTMDGCQEDDHAGATGTMADREKQWRL